MSNPKKPEHLKIIAGTDRADRVPDNIINLPLVDNIPSPPEWIKNEYAVQEWNRLAPILSTNKLLTEASLGPLGMLCALHGKIVQLWQAGESPTGHMMAQYRNLVNDFGLTPMAQQKVKPSEPEKKPSRFRNNGQRPS